MPSSPPNRPPGSSSPPASPEKAARSHPDHGPVPCRKSGTELGAGLIGDLTDLPRTAVAVVPPASCAASCRSGKTKGISPLPGSPSHGHPRPALEPDPARKNSGGRGPGPTLHLPATVCGYLCPNLLHAGLPAEPNCPLDVAALGRASLEAQPPRPPRPRENRGAHRRWSGGPLRRLAVMDAGACAGGLRDTGSGWGQDRRRHPQAASRPGGGSRTAARGGSYHPLALKRPLTEKGVPEAQREARRRDHRGGGPETAADPRAGTGTTVTPWISSRPARPERPSRPAGGHHRRGQRERDAAAGGRPPGRRGHYPHRHPGTGILRDGASAPRPPGRSSSGPATKAVTEQGVELADGSLPPPIR